MKLIVCKKCGATLSSNYIFCDKCGSRLGNESGIQLIDIKKKVIEKKRFKKNAFDADWIRANIKGDPYWLQNKRQRLAAVKKPVKAKINAIRNRYNHYKIIPIKEKKINQYIILKLEHGRTSVYINGKYFIQCIHLILNIPKDDIPLYEEVESIDEAAEVYDSYIYQNRIVRGHMAVPIRVQSLDITPEQEFWGHCSNIQAWVENDYDTRILTANISFPLLRVLAKAGDRNAQQVYKEEIALRLESGYPSVVQYLLVQGYIQEFTPSEFQTILESTNLIQKLSSNPKILVQFLRSCVGHLGPTLIEELLLKMLESNNFIQKLSSDPKISVYFLNSLVSRFPTLIEELLLKILESNNFIQKLSSDPKISVYFLSSLVSKFPTLIEELLLKILESNNFIQKLSSDPKILGQFFRSMISKFPSLFEDILLQILKFPNGKNNLISAIKISKPRFIRVNRVNRGGRSLFILKKVLKQLLNRVDENIGQIITDCIQEIDKEFHGLYDRESRVEVKYKVILIGDPSFKSRLLTNGAILGVSTYLEHPNIKIILMFYDVPRQPQFYKLHRAYFNGADGMILVFDVTRSATFSNVNNWYNSAVKYGLSEIPRILVGIIKDEESKKERKITLPMAEHLGKTLQAPYFEVFLDTGENIGLVFQTIAEMIYKRLLL